MLSTETLIVVSCGAAKLETPTPPRRLYTGAYTQLALAAADRLAAAATGGAHVRILSAEHGLLDPDGPPLEPYDTTLPPGPAGPDFWARFWDHPQRSDGRRELADVGAVLVLTGRRYLEAVHAVRPDALRPSKFETARGIGDQLACLRALADAPDPWLLLVAAGPPSDACERRTLAVRSGL